MAKPEWGTKRTCQNCGARFYDLKRRPITCPICETVHAEDRAARPRRAPAPAVSAAAEIPEGADDAPAPAAAEETEKIGDSAEGGIVDPNDGQEADIVVGGEDGDDDLIEDDIKLDDNDDMADVN
ncbi:MAG: TIGR02300 family protein [Rhodospirillales bacterium]|nr:TIGR02300 family protein [Rhodospirillales bacterium]MDP6772763.1 TIGR02300 family protein [Rhodospirillales bacterium]